MNRLLLSLIIVCTLAFAGEDSNASFIEKTVQSLIGPMLPSKETNQTLYSAVENEDMEFIALQAQLDELVEQETKESAWSTSYSTYNTYKDLKNRQESLSLEVKKLSLKKKKSKDIE